MNTRSARRAALALALAAPAAVAFSPAAFAAGGDAVVQATVAGGQVHVQSTKGLSRVTVVLCDGDTVVADRWGGDQKIGDVAVDGVVQAVFIHSGDNTTSAAQALLAALAGAGAVKGNSTGAIAFHDEHACDETPESSSTTTTSTTTTTGTPPSTTVTTGTPPSTTVTTDPSLPTTTSTTAGGTESPTTVTTASTSTPTSPTTPGTAEQQTTVLGATLEKPGPSPAASPEAAVSPSSMARTGAGHVMFLLTLAAGLVAAGILLLSAARRRRTA